MAAREAGAVPPPPEPVSMTVECLQCHESFDLSKLATNDRGRPVKYCVACYDLLAAERAERIRQEDADRAAEHRRRREQAKQEKLVADVNSVCRQFPVWDGANVTNQAFMQKVDPRLARMIRGWLPGLGHVWICGLTGSDKTMSLRALVYRWGDEIIASGHSDANFTGIVWAKAYRLVESIKWHRLGTGEPPEMTRAREATVLFLDDVGQEQPGQEHILFGLINDRYEQQKPTLVTCGLTIQEVGDRYGQHLYRRLCEKSVGTIIDLFPRRKLEAVK
jgi:hypothetical protein